MGLLMCSDREQLSCNRSNVLNASNKSNCEKESTYTTAHERLAGLDVSGELAWLETESGFTLIMEVFGGYSRCVSCTKLGVCRLLDMCKFCRVLATTLYRSFLKLYHRVVTT
jgi:hypothetical protein